MPYKDVNGNITFSEGYGIAFIRFPHSELIYPIGPVLVSPRTPRNTFSLSALVLSCSFKEATESMLSHCTFRDSMGNKTKVGCSVYNGLDYFQVEIVTFDSKAPTISALTRKSISSLPDQAIMQEAHLRLGHANFETLQLMSKKGIMKDIPNLHKVHPIACKCCFRQNRKHIPRNPVDTSTPPPCTVFGIDFAHYSHVSIRGHTSAFTIVERTYHYPTAFPCPSKRPPVAIIRFFVTALQRLGFTPAVFKMDEGGDLAKSTEFCKELSDMGLIIHSTGGDNKTSNGIVERFHQTLHQMNRSSLSTLKVMLPEKLPLGIQIESFWDVCLVYMVQIKRVLFSKAIGDSPYFLMHKRRPSFRDYPVFGSPCEVVKANKEVERDKLNSASRQGYFMGKGNNSGAFLVWYVENPSKLIRAHHVHINEAKSFSIQDGLFQIKRNSDPRPNYTPYIKKLSSPFAPEDVVSYTLPVPLYDLSPLGLKIVDDMEWNCPKLEMCIPDSIAYNTLAPQHRRNMHIVSINGMEPITARYSIDLITAPRRLTRKSKEKQTVIIELSKRVSRRRTNYEQLRAQMDMTAMRPIIASSSGWVIASHMAILPEPPPVHKFIFQAYSGKYKRYYKAATFYGFRNNAILGVYGEPILKKDLPKDALILPSVMAPSWKKDFDILNQYMFKVRHTVNGSGMTEGTDYKSSYSPVCAHESIKICLALAAAALYEGIGVNDAKNAFQTVIKFLSQQDPIYYCTVPKFFDEWFEEYYGRPFPGTPRDYAIPLFTNMQGQRDAGHWFYDLVLKVLKHYGFIRSPVDYGVFSKSTKFGIAYVLLSTDDFLALFPKASQLKEFSEYLEKYFEIKTNTGNVLHFLNMRITVGKQGISLDQTEAIITFCRQYWGLPEKLKSVKTPFRTDSELEKELLEDLPANPMELKRLEKEYGGSYRSIYGSLLYFSNHTRMDIAYAMCRWGKYLAAPTAAAFAGLRRICRYLAIHPHRPIFFPCLPITGNNLMAFHWSPKETETKQFPNELTCFNDAGEPQDLTDLRSITCNIHTMGGVAVTWEVKKTTSIPLHSTDAEIRSNSRATKRTKIFRHFLQSIGHIIDGPVIIYQDNAAVEAIMKACRCTPRTKYLGLHAAFCQQEQSRGNADLQYLKSSMMMADMGTKPLSGPALSRFLEWAIGVRFYPSKESQQHTHMALSMYNKTFIEICAEHKNRDSSSKS